MRIPGVDGIVEIEPLLVRDQVPLVRQVVRLIHDARTALASDLHVRLRPRHLAPGYAVDLPSATLIPKEPARLNCT